MTKFRVMYPSGATEEYEQSDCSTVAEFANTKFGTDAYAEWGVEVVIVDGEAKSAAAPAEVPANEPATTEWEPQSITSSDVGEMPADILADPHQE
jgi:hypothetical protein